MSLVGDVGRLVYMDFIFRGRVDLVVVEESMTCGCFFLVDNDDSPIVVSLECSWAYIVNMMKLLVGWNDDIDFVVVVDRRRVPVRALSTRVTDKVVTGSALGDGDTG